MSAIAFDLAKRSLRFNPHPSIKRDVIVEAVRDELLTLAVSILIPQLRGMLWGRANQMV